MYNDLLNLFSFASEKRLAEVVAQKSAATCNHVDVQFDLNITRIIPKNFGFLLRMILMNAKVLMIF